MAIKFLNSKADYTEQEINEIMHSCEQYRERLIKYCLQYFDYEREYAEDCVQNAYTALLENLRRGINIKNHYAWLYKVTINHKNKAIKEKRKRNEYSFTDNEEKEAAINNIPAEHVDFSESLISDKDIEKRAIEIISSLNEKEKELYFLYYLKNQNLKQISKHFGISHAAARQRHVELKKKIKRLVENSEWN